MSSTLLLDDELDRILVRLARDIIDSDTMIAAFLALFVADRQGNGPGIRRALDEVRALAGLDRITDQDAVIYRLCSTCHALHAETSCTETR